MAEAHTFIIIDDQLEKIEGHPYEYNKSVAIAFRERGFKVVMYGDHKLPTSIQNELNAKPWFKFNSTSSVRKIPILGPLLYRYHFAKSFQQQMKALLKKVSDEETNFIFFIPNVYWYNILPIAKSLKNTVVPAGFLFRTSIFDAIRVPPVMKPFILPLIRYSVNILKGNKNVHHFTDSDVIAREWQAYFNHPMHVLPIPHITPPLAEYISEKTGKMRLYLPGGMRLEKGADLLTRSMELLVKSHPEIAGKIVLTTQFSGNDPTLEAYKSRLAALAIENELLGNLTSEDYSKTLASADIILIPYQVSDGYRARTSGVLAEAIAAQKPVITTKGTWMALETDKYQAGLIIEENPEDFVEKLLEMIQNYNLYQQHVKEASDKWMKFHSKEHFFHSVMNVMVA